MSELDLANLYPLIRSVCASVSPGDEDLVQEVCLRLLTGAHRVEDMTAGGGYLYRIARNIHIDRIRQNTARKRRENNHAQTLHTN